MKRPPSVPPRGFTLIELLVVITVIMILAGLTMSLFGYGNKKAASDRARAEISALELALESYKIENGDYPRDEKTDALNPRIHGDAHVVTGGNTPYMLASLAMYKALSGDENLDGKGGDRDTTTDTKRQMFFEFKPGMLYPRVANGTARTADSVKAVIDPFRNSYGYSTAGSKTNTVAGTDGYNPTFDLWSTADSDNNKTASDEATQKTWIKNW